MEENPKSTPTNILKLAPVSNPDQDQNSKLQGMLNSALEESKNPDEDGDLCVGGVTVLTDRWGNIRALYCLGNPMALAGVLSTVLYQINQSIWEGDDDE